MGVVERRRGRSRKWSTGAEKREDRRHA